MSKAKYYKIGIVVSRFNEVITGNLLKGALKGLTEKGIDEKDIDVFFVPGAFEIPLVLKKLLSASDSYAGLIALGCLIKGETAHFEYISGPVSESINRIMLEFEKPVSFGVLTCYTPQQAYERSLVDPITSEGNKGYESAAALIEMLELLNKIS